jgi:hypothetical protein
MTLVGCAKDHNCGPNSLKTVENGHVLSPWVKVVFREGDGGLITVGNHSSPSLANSAVIKSFNFGFSTGSECKITIHDTMGSSLGVFLKNMMKELKDASDRFIVVEWGWTKAGCPSPPPNSRSKPHYMMLVSLETNFIQGKFIHEITATDTMAASLQGGIEEIYGEDTKNSLSLKDALKKLLMEDPAPKVKSVKYCRIEPDGKINCNDKEVGFKENDPEGPKHSWKGNAANKLEVARKWVSSWHTNNKDKVFEMEYNSKVDGGEVIFWERPTIKCDENFSENFCIGTYIVNGGADSPVIEFNPRIKWDFGPASVVGGQMAARTIEDKPQNKAQGIEECPQLSRKESKGAGNVSSSPTTSQQLDINNDKSTGTQMDAEALHKMLDGIHVMEDGIMADMVIVGDPTFPTQADGVIDGKTVAIAFINPLHLVPDNSICGDWLASPPCNEWLSNNNWLVQKVNHRIENGTYTTSLSLRLTTPGFDSPVGSPMGNSPNGATIQ